MNSVGLYQKKLAILQEISSAIVLTDDVGTIANLMLDLATAHTQAESGSIMLLNNQGELFIMASRGLDSDTQNNSRIRLGEGIAGMVAKNRKPVLVQDIEKDPVFKKRCRERYKTRSFICCPILVKNDLLGLISINDRQDGNAFSEDDFLLIKIIANQAAIALKNALLVNQLKSKAFELEELNRKLIDSNLAKTEFLTRISHELRTPLNSINGAIYYLKQTENKVSSEQNEFLDILAGETHKIVAIVEGQLDFLRTESEAVFVKKSIINLLDIIEEILGSRLVRDTLNHRCISVVTEFPSKMSLVAGDKVLVTQLFINLIEGLAYHLENARITLRATEDESLHIAIETSLAFPEWVIGQLFNSKTFFQADQSDGILKLYLARKTADNHGWVLRAHNHENVFRIDLDIPKGSRQKIEAALSTTMDLYLEFVSELLDLNTCSIMLTDPLTGDLVIKSAKGLDEDIIQKTRIRVGERIAGWVAQEGRPLLIEDIDKDPRFPQRVGAAFYNSKSLLSLPLKVSGETIGVINLNNKRSAKAFNSRDMALLSVIGERIAHLVEKLQGEGHKEDDLHKMAITFENLLAAGRRYQKKNPRLLELMEQLAQKLQFSEELHNEALYTALIYDLGLMLIDKEVLNKKKKLSLSETNTIKVHPHTTLNLLGDIEFSPQVCNAILHHHEHWDGSGYPEKLSGDRIPILSRVLAVVDAYVAMTEERPYRKALSHDQAVAEMRRESGSKFDPTVVAALESIFSKD